ncbi:hypothetical protein SAMN05216256_1462 [Halopseudomonas pachastrellae]|nr:hypothetical protein SAMN05216256_1462 [Halopseudomonas pachastrellae]
MLQFLPPHSDVPEVQFQYSRTDRHLGEQHGNTRKNPLWYLESSHPQKRMAYHFEDFSYKT